MSNVCCKEFKGWCKSFTKTETYLTVLEVLFLVVLITSLTFVILHFLACYKNKNINKVEQIIETSSLSTIITENEVILDTSASEMDTTSQTPLVKKKECTWEPSVKTTAATHYYDMDVIPKSTDRSQAFIDFNTLPNSASYKLKQSISLLNHTEPVIEDITNMLYDGKEVDEIMKSFLLALVKIKPPQDIVYGCILTIVAPSWTLAAASCIEAIEEVDSLDSFVMMRGYGEKETGSIHTVSDVLIHPQYEGVNVTYDLAALKSEDILVKGQMQIVSLATMADYLSLTIGESLSILGYGKYRNFDKDPQSRSVREVSVYVLPSQQCPEGEAWAPRQLWGGGRAARGACGRRALCAGALRARARPCHYCAGVPLLHRRRLLALLARNPHCGLACPPATYVTLPALADWLHSTIHST